eukprot:8008152-Pyramimonas_sp.AAC.1
MSSILPLTPPEGAALAQQHICGLPQWVQVHVYTNVAKVTGRSRTCPPHRECDGCRAVNRFDGWLVSIERQ